MMLMKPLTRRRLCAIVVIPLSVRVITVVTLLLDVTEKDLQNYLKDTTLRSAFVYGRYDTHDDALAALDVLCSLLESTDEVRNPLETTR